MTIASPTLHQRSSWDANSSPRQFFPPSQQLIHQQISSNNLLRIISESGSLGTQGDNILYALWLLSPHQIFFSHRSKDKQTLGATSKMKYFLDCTRHHEGFLTLALTTWTLMRKRCTSAGGRSSPKTSVTTSEARDGGDNWGRLSGLEVSDPRDLRSTPEIRGPAPPDEQLDVPRHSAVDSCLLKGFASEALPEKPLWMDQNPRDEISTQPSPRGVWNCLATPPCVRTVFYAAYRGRATKGKTERHRGHVRTPLITFVPRDRDSLFVLRRLFDEICWWINTLRAISIPGTSLVKCWWSNCHRNLFLGTG